VAVALAGVGVGVGVAVGEGVGQATAVKVTVFDMVTWLLVIRRNTVNVPPPEPPKDFLRSSVAPTFCEASATTFTTKEGPPVRLMMIWC
jgi:hypothetical protein